MRRNKAWFFRNNPLLEGIDDEALGWFDQRAEVLQLKRRQSLWEAGQDATHTWWLRSGVIKVHRPGVKGRELTLGFFTKEAMLGEEGVLGARQHMNVAHAYDDCTVYAIPSADVRRVIARWPDLGFRIGLLALRRRQMLESRVDTLLFRAAHARLARMLLDLVSDFGVRDSRGVIINLKLTHKEMAALIGATRETVSFAILDMRKRGLLQTESKRVVIMDRPGLEAMALS
ncbi:MAG: CRP/FNR family cyclic AMP-dependent transcriptional regulator [Kiritimatiellia bacterium]|jgi:CRP/FNR family cyclic AMP-dependent transcriptional regulator